MIKKIAIIPARGGSTRIPKKNIRSFLDKPIIAYSIEAAIKSKLFNEIMVSTDDDKIAEISKEYGASIPFFRSAKTSDDYATTADVLVEVINEYIKLGENFEYLCCIYPTAAFITAEKLKDSFALLIKSNVESLIPVVKFSYPIQRALRIRDNKLRFIWPENETKRSQDLEPIYHDAGQFYWRTIDSLLKTKSLIASNSIPYILSEMEVQDIDNHEDWEIAEIKFKLFKKNRL